MANGAEDLQKIIYLLREERKSHEGEDEPGEDEDMLIVEFMIASATELVDAEAAIGSVMAFADAVLSLELWTTIGTALGLGAFGGGVAAAGGA